MTPPSALSRQAFTEACARAADAAFVDGWAKLFIGVDVQGRPLLADFAKHRRVPGAVVIVPDVKLAELAANGLDVRGEGWTLERADGRTARLFRAPEGGAA
jgi:hypothetical protein